MTGGLSKDAALKALTLNAATVAGAAERLGSLDRGKIANIVVADGDIFEEKTAITHVFVDGRPGETELMPSVRCRVKSAELPTHSYSEL